jgi:hypothetical protein
VDRSMVAQNRVNIGDVDVDVFLAVRM